MKSHVAACRRDFLKTTFAGGMAAVLAGRLIRSTMAAAPAAPAAPVPAPAAGTPVRVALTNGNDRTDNIVRALKSLEKEIAAAIGNRRVVIKPNLVAGNNPLACSHIDGIAGIIDFLKSIGKADNLIIAESSAGPTMQAFENQNYPKLADKYKVKLVNLEDEKYITVMAFDQSDARPRAVRVSAILANQADNFIISACMPKTHNYALATMSIKNIILGSGMKFATNNAGRGGAGARGGMIGVGMGGGGGMGGMGGAGRAGGAGAGGRTGGGGGAFGMFTGTNDKTILHGGGSYGININLSMLAPLLHPSLAVIDGFEGMEGEGPGNGTKVDHRICVVSTDYVAADTVGATLMGINISDLGYLTYLINGKVGEGDLSKMEIIGEKVEKLVKKYALPRTAQQQMQWKSPAKVSAVQ
jgi:uncharacterized protein (DUF362 family)